MDEKQKLKIRENLDELVESLHHTIDLLVVNLRSGEIINDEEEVMLEVARTSKEKLRVIMQILQSKEKGWNALIKYLNKNKHYDLVNRLQDEIPDLVSMFSGDLARYYKRTCQMIPTKFGPHLNIEQLRTLIMVEDNAGDSTIQKDDHLSHTELLQVIRKNPSTNVAVVAGERGTGKSTLVKKIAHEWGEKFLGDSMHSYFFDLVLLVPLRQVEGKSENFLELAIKYFMKILKTYAAQEAQLFEEISRLKSRILICFDGLDEYADFAISPFKLMFAVPFKFAKDRSHESPLPHDTYKIIITSRAYACERIREDFCPIRLSMTSLDKYPIEEFVGQYCQSEKVANTVVEFVKNEEKRHGKEILAVPLLTSICNMVDSTNIQGVPTKLTSLYERFTQEMLMRENRDDKLSEKLGKKYWIQSKVVKSTGALAFWGCKERRTEFTEEHLENCNVKSDSFTCGYLLPRYNFNEQCLKAYFRDRYLQEFFAALHCYNQMFSGDNTLQKWILLQICDSQSQLGRFFFGLCSHHKKFSNLLHWITPELENCSFLLNLAIDQLMISLSHSLSDCSEKETREMSKKWILLLSKFGNHIKAKRDKICWPYGKPLRKLPDDTLSSSANLGIYFQHKTWAKKSFYDWLVIPSPRCNVPLAVISQEPNKKLWDEYASNEERVKIDALVWLLSPDMATEIFTHLPCLPSSKLFVIRTHNFCQWEINLRIRYKKSGTNQDPRLKHLSFGFAKSQYDVFRASFSGLGIDARDGTEISFHGSEVSESKFKIVWTNVTVKRYHSQDKLIKALISQFFEQNLFHKVIQPTNCILS